MESKLNHAQVAQYSEAFARELSESFFANQLHISGQEILQLAPLKQVNFFVVRHLFVLWQKETENLRSAFFDYRNDEVRKALKDFMNVLSQHISVARKEFEPLLGRAVEDTLILVLEPYTFFNREFNKDGRSRLRSKELKELGKYLKLNKEILLGVLERMGESGGKEIFVDDALAHLDEVMAEQADSLEDSEAVLAKLGDVLPVAIDSLLIAPKESGIGVEEPGDVVELPVAENVAEVAPTSELEAIEPIEESAVEELSPKLASAEDSADNSEEQKPATLNEAFQAPDSQPTLNERLSGSQDTQPTLADNFKQQRITSIKKHITINQRYMFVQRLFGGSTDEFNQAVEQLEQFANIDAAIAFLEKEYIERHNWDMDTPEVMEFLEIVGKRY